MDGCEKHQTMLVNGHTLLNMYSSKYNEENLRKYAFNEHILFMYSKRSCLLEN